MKRAVILSVLLVILLAGCMERIMSSEQKKSIESPVLISRQSWKAQPPVLDRMKEQKVSAITIHHAGVKNKPDSDNYAYMRNLQRFSQKDRPWGDIPYHFVIDEHGKIFEARDLQYQGDSNTNYDLSGHLQICVKGNFEIEVPSDKVFDCLVDLTAYMAEKYQVEETRIKTHKDYVQTACPGKNLYARFSSREFYEKVEKRRIKYHKTMEK